MKVRLVYDWRRIPKQPQMENKNMGVTVTSPQLNIIVITRRS